MATVSTTLPSARQTANRTVPSGSGAASAGGDPAAAWRPGTLAAGRPAARAEHAGEGRAVEHRVPVGARGDPLQLAGFRRRGLAAGAGALGGQGELPAAHAIEEEDGGEK